APGRTRVSERGAFYAGNHCIRTDGPWVDEAGNGGKRPGNGNCRAMDLSADIGDYPGTEQSIGIHPWTTRGPVLHSVEQILIKIVRRLLYKSFSAEFSLPYSLV